MTTNLDVFTVGDVEILLPGWTTGTDGVLFAPCGCKTVGSLRLPNASISYLMHINVIQSVADVAPKIVNAASEFISTHVCPRLTGSI